MPTADAYCWKFIAGVMHGAAAALIFGKTGGFGQYSDQKP